MTIATPQPVLQADSLSVRYGGNVVVGGVSLEVRAGEIVTLIGPNGSGKTTLLRALAGLLPATGRVHLQGRPIDTLSRRAVSRVLAYLPQTPTGDTGDRVREVLALGRAPHVPLLGLERVEDAVVVDEVAAALELSSLLDRPLGTLSGGQRQRVFLGRALAQQPAVLLLDEPATYLDVRHQVELHRLLRTLTHDRRMAIVMASHDLNLAATHADSAVLLKDGRALASGPVGQVLTTERLTMAFDTPMRRVDIEGRSHILMDA